MILLIGTNLKGSVYLITSKTAGKHYIGVTTTSLQRRWSRHKSKAKTGIISHLYNAIRKYGVKDFTIKVLEICTYENLYKQEIYWINYLNTFYSGYNSTKGGEGFGNNPLDPSVVCKSIVSDIIMTVPKSVFDATSALVGVTAGRILSSTEKTLRSKNNGMLKHTPETIAKIKATKANQPRPIGNPKKGVITVYNHNGEIVESGLHSVEAQKKYVRSITNTSKNKPLGSNASAKGYLNNQNNLHLIGYYIIRN